MIPLNDFGKGISELLRWETLSGKVFTIMLLTGMSVIMAISVHKFGFAFGSISIVLIIGVVIALISLVHIEFGFYTIITLGFFVNFFKRLIFGLNISHQNIPLGITISLLMGVTCLGLIIRESFNRKSNWTRFWTPITLIILLDLIYSVVIAANPIGPGLSTWFELGFRWMIFDLMLIFVAYSIFNSLRKVIFFTKFWVGLMVISGVYTLFQEYVTLPIWDYRFLTSDPTIFKLNYIGGRFRLSGLLGDVSEAGLFMAYTSIVLLVFTLYANNNKKRITLLISMVITSISMSLSGTRTAYAIFAIGIVLLGLIHIREKYTLIAATFGIISLLIILYGPVYTPTVQRIRSTFEPQNDPSYQLREAKWSRVQPWLRDHPIGSGIGTVGPLDPEKEEADSGYVAEAIERGWIGLILKLALCFTVLSFGTNYFFNSENKIYKALYLAYVCGFFAMSIAHMSQDALNKWPSYIIIESSFIALIRLRQFETNKTLDD